VPAVAFLHVDIDQLHAVLPWQSISLIRQCILMLSSVLTDLTAENLQPTNVYRSIPALSKYLWLIYI